jgi:hypothetical protein
MSNEIMENPVFASKYISKFTHYDEINDILLENLQFEEQEGVEILLLPIIDQVPENKKGIVRTFIKNKSFNTLMLNIYYNQTGWFSDLPKNENLRFLESFTIGPSEIWVRDIEFRSMIKQGKNYLQIVATQEKSKKPKEFVSAHIEYTQTREIIESIQIERSNYMGMLSKAYINPRSLKYWIFYSIFGKRIYRKENIFIFLLKRLLLLAGITFFTLYFVLPRIFEQGYVLPLSIIAIVVSLFSFFLERDAKKLKIIHELGLSESDKKASLKLVKETYGEFLLKFCTNDINFDYDLENDIVHWKEGANRLYEKIIPVISQTLNIPANIKPPIKFRPSRVEVFEDKEQLKEKIEKGIELQHEEGVRFRDEIKEVAKDIDGVEISIDVIESDTQIEPEYKGIKTEPHIDSKIDPIVTKTSVEPEIEKIESKTAVEPEIEKIESKTIVEPIIEPVKTKTEGLISGEREKPRKRKSIDFDAIPEPRKLPKDDEE